MTNRNYIKGYTLERSVKLYYEGKKYLSARASGSHGLFDVWATDGHQLILIQCKAGGNQAYASRVLEEIKRELPFPTVGITIPTLVQVVTGMKKGEPVVEAEWTL